MIRFDRQLLIPGWDQARLEDARVVVCGHDWSATFTVWALASMGIGEIVWIGRPQGSAAALAAWFLAEPSPFSGVKVSHYPLEVEYGPELEWAMDGGAEAIVVAHADSRTLEAAQALAARLGIPLESGSAEGGGWLGLGAPAQPERNEHPAIAMLVAALLADSVREHLSPLWGGSEPPAGALGFQAGPLPRPLKATLVGVGGIGVYAATAAAALGVDLALVDFDRVEETNLNRQGLFGPSDAAAREFKAVAAARALLRFFPEREFAPRRQRIARGTVGRLAGPRAGVLLSAVDNAATRLALSAAAFELGVPLIQGGTDVFMADCYTQDPAGVPLDRQMHGAMADAAARETRRPRRAGGCAANPSYVVPGMAAGALMALRLLDVANGRRDCPPLHWRSGLLPVERSTHGFDFERIAVRSGGGLHAGQ